MASAHNLTKAKEVNKIAGAVIGSMLAVMLIGKIGTMVVSPRPLAETVYPVPATAEHAPAEAAAPAAVEPIGPQLAAADVAAGATVARQCQQCHTFEQGGRNLMGPNLHGVIGRARAAVAGFGYSAAMRAAGGEWDYESLNRFIVNPRAEVRGTSMSYPGMRSATQRANLIRWMREQGSQSVALPSN